MKELSLVKQVSPTKQDTVMYVHTKTKTGHCVSPCLHVAGHLIRITNGVMLIILQHSAKNITKNGILIINSYSMYLLPMENVIIAVLFLIGMLNFLLAVMILLLMKLICLKLFQLLLILSRYMEALICTLIIYFMIVYI